MALASPKPHAPIHIAESCPCRRRDSSYYAAVGVAKRSRIDVLETDLLCTIIGPFFMGITGPFAMVPAPERVNFRAS